MLWRREDEFATELCTLLQIGSGFALRGTVLDASEGGHGRIDYDVRVDRQWRTRAVKVDVERAGEQLRLRLRGDGRGAWWRDDQPVSLPHECVDVDLSFTPATNTLPIRRLQLAAGERAETRALWVLPRFALKPIEQSYERLDGDVYRYRSATTTAVLVLDEQQLVRMYEGLWHAVPGG